MQTELTKERKKKLFFMGIILIIIPFLASALDPMDFSFSEPKILLLFAAALFGGISSIYLSLKKPSK